MAGDLYVPLRVGYADDPKIIDAGPMTELLYVRSLAFAKRQRKDGWIADSQLAAFSLRIPGARRHAARLVELGLWERNGAGWYVTAWLRHNKADAEIQQAKSTAAKLGNHNRWHLGAKGVPKVECDLCQEQGLIR
jgi:hypothetical protein